MNSQLSLKILPYHRDFNEKYKTIVLWLRRADLGIDINKKWYNIVLRPMIAI